MENLLYALMLAIHNIVLIIFSGGLLSLWLLTKDRPAQGQDSLQAFDHLVEKSMIAHPQGYVQGLILLGLTGMGMPVVHYLYHGAIKGQTVVSWSAFGAKMALVTVLFIILMQWMIRVEKPIGEAYRKASEQLQKEDARRYFALAADRTRFLRIGWILAMVVLVVTPFITFFQI